MVQSDNGDDSRSMVAPLDYPPAHQGPLLAWIEPAPNQAAAQSDFVECPVGQDAGRDDLA